MKLSEEETNLLMLFAGFLCASTHDHADGDCDGEFIEHAEKFIAEFDRNALELRIEIAPAREPMMERGEQ